MPKIIEIPETDAVAPPPTPVKSKARIIELPDTAEANKQGDNAIDHPALANAGVYDKPTAIDYFRHYIGKYVPEGLKALGAGLGATAGEGVASVPGAMAGAGVGSVTADQLQSSFPRVFGESPNKDGGDVALNTLGDAVSYGAVPEIGGKLASAGLKPLTAKLIAAYSKTGLSPAVGEGVAKVESAMAKKKYSMPSSDIVETAADNARNRLANLTPTQQVNLGSHAGTVVDDLINVPYNQKGFSTTKLKEITTKALSDVSEVRNFKLATGEGGTIRQLANNEIINAGYDGSTQVFDPKKILSKLGGDKAEIYKEAMGSKEYENFNNFWQQAQKDESSSGKVLNYLKNRMWLAIPAATLGMGSAAGTAGAAGALVVTDAMLGRLMKNPEIAQLTTKALRTGLQTPAASFTTKAIMNALRGTEAMIRTPEGKLEKVYVQENGSLSTMKPGP